MKDYSDIMTLPYSYISHYEIVNNEILVYTSNRRKKPLVYPATKENVQKIEKRLEAQYKVLIDSSDILMKSHLEGKRKIIFGIVGAISFVLMFFGIGLLITSGMVLCFWGSLISSLSLLGIGAVLMKKIEKNFKEEISLIKEYYNNRKNIELVNDKDDNVTRNLTRKTKKEIEKNKKLKESEVIESVFNMALLDNMLDSMGVDELKELLNGYNASCELSEELKLKGSVKTRKREKN